MKAITQVPVKFMGLGEKPDDFDVFHPDRMASRILGMGDVVSLVEKAEASIDQEEAERMAKRLQSSEFNLEDFLGHMQQIKKMGSLNSVFSMLPGVSGMKMGEDQEKQMVRSESIILSMTLKERRNPRILRGSRLKRIADGSGVQVRDVNALLKQYSQMHKMMKKMKGSKGRKMMKAMQSKMGGDLGGLEGLPGLPKF